MRLRPGQHLRRQSDIRDVREQGSRVDCRAFTALVAAPGTASALRAGLLRRLDTQAVGKAILRNRAKRRMREIFRRHQKLLPASVRPAASSPAPQVNSWPFAQLERTFAEACGRMAPAPAPGTHDRPPSHSPVARGRGSPRPPRSALSGSTSATASPLLPAILGPACGCRFYPTCSHYAAEAVATHGAVRGAWLCGPAHRQVHAPASGRPRSRPAAVAAEPTNPVDKKNTVIGALLFIAAFFVLIYSQKYARSVPRPPRSSTR